MPFYKHFSQPNFKNTNWIMPASACMPFYQNSSHPNLKNTNWIMPISACMLFYQNFSQPNPRNTNWMLPTSVCLPYSVKNSAKPIPKIQLLWCPPGHIYRKNNLTRSLKDPSQVSNTTSGISPRFFFFIAIHISYQSQPNNHQKNSERRYD